MNCQTAKIKLFWDEEKIMVDGFYMYVTQFLDCHSDCTFGQLSVE